MTNPDIQLGPTVNRIPAILVALTLMLAACSADPFEGTGIDCEPMTYQLDNEVWVLQAGERARLSEDGLVGANPTLSSDATMVAFTSGVQGGDLDLFVINTDGSNRRLVWGSDLIQSSADWSPDDAVLVFDQDSQPGGPLQVFTIPTDGSGEAVQLTHGEPNGKPKWGPDGRILFLSLWDAEEQEIYSMNPDGSELVNLTNDPARDVLAEMSPDGAAIAFASDRSGDGEFDIWLMDPDGANVRRLTDDPARDTNPTWSSDGTHILFRSDREPAGLWAIEMDGSNPTLILEDGWLADCP